MDQPTQELHLGTARSLRSTCRLVPSPKRGSDEVTAAYEQRSGVPRRADKMAAPPRKQPRASRTADYPFRTEPATPAWSSRARPHDAGITSPIAETGAGRAGVQIADLRRHARPECSSPDPMVPLSEAIAGRRRRAADGLARCRLKPAALAAIG